MPANRYLFLFAFDFNSTFARKNPGAVIDDWFESHQISPRIAGEFEDSALLKAFGEAGFGVFAAPTVIEAEICRMYRMSVIGTTDEIKERFYAISLERRLKHESIVLITDTARTDLFSAT